MWPGKQYKHWRSSRRETRTALIVVRRVEKRHEARGTVNEKASRNRKTHGVAPCIAREYIGRKEATVRLEDVFFQPREVFVHLPGEFTNRPRGASWKEAQVRREG